MEYSKGGGVRSRLSALGGDAAAAVVMVYDADRICRSGMTDNQEPAAVVSHVGLERCGDQGLLWFYKSALYLITFTQNRPSARNAACCQPAR